jgi:hypothetical protein
VELVAGPRRRDWLGPDCHDHDRSRLGGYLEGVGRADRWMNYDAVERAGAAWLRPSRSRQGSSSRPAASRHRRSRELDGTVASGGARVRAARLPA